MSTGNFAQIRSLLSGEVNEEAWKEITDVFHEWETTAEFGLAVDLVNAHLEDLPNAIRVVPEKWKDVLLGEPKSIIQRKWPKQTRAHPAIAIARVLDLRGRKKLTPTQAKTLCKEPVLSSIRELYLNQVKLGENACYELAESSHISNLDFLGLSSCSLGVQGIWDLAESSLFQGLKRLDVGGNDIGLEGVRALTENCVELVGLAFGYRVERDSWQLLCEAESMQYVRSFELASGISYDLSTQNFFNILNHAVFAGELRDLGLGNFFSRDDERFEPFLELELPKLESLDLRWWSLDSNQVEQICKHSIFSRLKSLTVTEKNVEFEQLKEHFGDSLLAT